MQPTTLAQSPPTQFIEPSILNLYGVHKGKNGVKHLFQDLCPRGWNFFGLQEDSGYSVKSLRNGCSHAINPVLTHRPVADKHLETFQSFSDDPLVQAMLPVPNGKVYFLDETILDNHVEWLSCLERLNSPLHSWVKPFWSSPLRKIITHLEKTNIHPMVLTGVKPTDAMDIAKLLEHAIRVPRTLILVGDPSVVLPKYVARLDTKIDQKVALSTMIKLPLEHIGAHLVSEHCQGVE